MESRRWDCGAQTAEQGERVEVDGDGAAGVGATQVDADEAVGQPLEPVLCDGRTQDVAQESFAATRVARRSGVGRVQGEARAGGGQRRCQLDPVLCAQGDGLPAVAALGTRRGKARNGCGGESRPGWLTLGDVAGKDAQGVVAFDDTEAK